MLSTVNFNLQEYMHQPSVQQQSQQAKLQQLAAPFLAKLVAKSNQLLAAYLLASLVHTAYLEQLGIYLSNYPLSESWHSHLFFADEDSHSAKSSNPYLTVSRRALNCSSAPESVCGVCRGIVLLRKYTKYLEPTEQQLIGKLLQQLTQASSLPLNPQQLQILVQDSLSLFQQTTNLANIAAYETSVIDLAIQGLQLSTDKATSSMVQTASVLGLYPILFHQITEQLKPGQAQSWLLACEHRHISRHALYFSISRKLDGQVTFNCYDPNPDPKLPTKMRTRLKSLGSDLGYWLTAVGEYLQNLAPYSQFELQALPAKLEQVPWGCSFRVLKSMNLQQAVASTGVKTFFHAGISCDLYEVIKHNGKQVSADLLCYEPQLGNITAPIQAGRMHGWVQFITPEHKTVWRRYHNGIPVGDSH